MTRHYRLDGTATEISASLEAHPGRDPWNGGELLPGNFAPTVTRSAKSGTRQLRPMVWGYPAPGPNAIGADGQINWVPTVRNLASPFWIGNLRHSELRCLVPATSFMLRANGRSHWFGVADMPIFAMAGIWRDLTDMPVFAILCSATSGAPREAGAFAMPVIIDPANQHRWLSADWHDAQHLVTPFAGAMISSS